MKNEIVFVKSSQETEIIHNSKINNYFIAKIDGNNISTLDDYMNAIIIAFKFPSGIFRNINNIDAYNDWMRDLSWLDKYNGYILFIENFKVMMKNDMRNKEIIMKGFSGLILPFWQDEVKHTVVDSKNKIFNIYLIN